MNAIVNGVVAATGASFKLPTPILEIGSMQIPGQDGDLRRYFPGQDYVGLDMRPGPGVDCVGNVEHLPQADGSVGTILSLCTFEHVKRFWLGFEEMHRVLRPDGALLVAVPFHFHIHNYPSDYWRFTPDALAVMLEKYPQHILGWHGPKKRPHHVWALAFREEHPAITSGQVEVFRKNLRRFANQPLEWNRRWRYALGALLFGRGHFAGFLDHNQVELRSQLAA